MRVSICMKSINGRDISFWLFNILQKRSPKDVENLYYVSSGTPINYSYR